MAMIDDLIASAKETLLDRLTSPLIGSFVVAWPLWNYKFVMILLAESSVTTTLQMIDAIAFPDAWSIAWRGFIAPALSAAAYVFAYPYPARFVYRFARSRQAELLAIRQEIEGNELLSIDQSRKMRSEARAEVMRQRGISDELLTENQRLRSELDASSAQAAKLAEEVRRLTNPGAPEKEGDAGAESATAQVGLPSLSTTSIAPSLTDIEYRVLDSLQRIREASRNETVKAEDLAGKAGVSILHAQAAVDHLMELGFVKNAYYGLAVEAKGRSALIARDTLD
jgi:hypothetical protein